MAENVIKYNLWTNFVAALKNSFKIAGRANRYEYWGFVIFDMIAYPVVYYGLMFLFILLGALLDYSGVSSAISTYSIVALVIIGALFRIFMIIPMITIGIRRLHDINKSGWWLLLPLAPVLLLVIMAFVSALFKYSGIEVPTYLSIISGFLSVFVILGAVIYCIYLFCKKSVNENNAYGEPNKGIKEDKEGVKFIFMYFIFIFVIGFIAGFLGYKGAMEQQQKSRYNYESFASEEYELDNNYNEYNTETYNVDSNDYSGGVETENYEPEEYEYDGESLDIEEEIDITDDIDEDVYVEQYQ